VSLALGPTAVVLLFLGFRVADPRGRQTGRAPGGL